MHLDTTQTNIVIEDLSGEWKSLGNVRPIVKLPEVYYAPYARIVVLIALRNGGQCRQIGSLMKGGTYFINPPSPGDSQLAVALAQ